jgi:predicted dehydrogenase
VYAPDDSAAELAGKVGAQVAGSGEEVIDGADVVLIGSPTDTHADYVVQIAAAGKPALCASPAAAREADLDKIAQAAAGKANLYASFPLRARPEYQRLKSAMASGELGTIGMIRLGMCLPKQTGWRADAARSGGAVVETGVHLIDWLDWLAGPITRIYGASPDAGDTAYDVLVARLGDGAIAHLEISWAEAQGVSFDYYEVAGSNGLLAFDSRQSPLMVVEKRGADAGPEVVNPGATAAEHELRSFLAKAAGGQGGFTSLERGVEICRTALQVKAGISAGQVVTLR